MYQSLNLFKRSLSFILITSILVLILVSCEDNDDDGLTSDDKEAIVSIMNATQQEMQAPGWIVGIETPSKLHEYAGGFAEEDAGTDMIPSDLLRIGSISKSFTATLVLILCDEGELHLNNKLSSYYPGFPDAENISIKHLLNHTSGIVSWDENEEIRMEIFNGTGNWTIDKLIEWAEQEDLLAEPGDEFHYSNIGYFLLGEILEEASGYTVAELLEAKICLPLKLYNTFMPIVPHPGGDIIHGYDGSSGSVVDMTGTPQADAINFELAWTAGGIISSLDDLSVWCRALANGELLSDSMYMAQMPVLNPPTPELPYWSGYGMGVSQTDVWMGHTGAICGFICNMQYNQEDDVSIVSYFNKFSAFDANVNATDISAAGQNFMKLARYMCPETLVD